MPSNDKADELRLGFLTAVEVADRGYVGGLLVTNRFGRPLEFQCTSPVQPNRMQEILYGPTLLPYVLAELIGTTLLEKVGIKPHLVLTEQEQLLELRSQISIPVALVKNAATISETAHDEMQPVCEAPVAAALPETRRELRLGRQFLRFHDSHAADRETVAAGATSVPAEADLCEPFTRVREALEETTRAGNAR
jgi:hypothetical protein